MPEGKVPPIGKKSFIGTDGPRLAESPNHPADSAQALLRTPSLPILARTSTNTSPLHPLSVHVGAEFASSLGASGCKILELIRLVEKEVGAILVGDPAHGVERLDILVPLRAGGGAEEAAGEEETMATCVTQSTSALRHARYRLEAVGSRKV